MRVALFFLLLVNTTFSHALDIKKAYSLIPHQQTPFITLQSELPRTEANYLTGLLTLAELAVVERVNAGRIGPNRSHYNSNVKSILWQLDELRTPASLKQVHQHVVIAIEDQRSYFQLYSSNDSQSQQSKKKLVNSSH